MKQFVMGRGFMQRGQRSLFLLFVLLVLICLCATQEEDFSCHTGDGLVKKEREIGGSKERERRPPSRNRSCRRCAVIIPRGDIIVEVGKQTKEVFCRFNSSLISTDDVYFTTSDDREIHHQVVNSSTIRTEIFHSEPKKYVLYCKLKRKKKEDKELCSQIVSSGYPPLDIVNFKCISFNNENVNCSWERPNNPVTTQYMHPNFSVPKYMIERSKITQRSSIKCPETNAPFFTWCFWDKSSKLNLRYAFKLHITGTNKLGEKTYEHNVSVPEIVIPKKIAAQVELVGPVRANITWNLTYPMDAFLFGLWHNVENRLKGEDTWSNVTFFFHKINYTTLDMKQTFFVEDNLPYANTMYEFRVRIHSGVKEIKDNMWSSFDVLNITSEAMRPSKAPRTSFSSFEVDEVLDTRDIYVNYRDVDKLWQGGRDFGYNIVVYSSSSELVDVKPAEVTQAYFKYKFMNFTEYKFRIIPVNEKGAGTVYSEVVVPNSVCMPKKTEMFTVISTSTKSGKIFSLYWVPSHMPNKQCQGSNPGIDSYTIFWCKKAFGYRCKKKLYWKDIKNENLVIKDLRNITPSDIVIYENNVTDLLADQPYSFGVAANSGNFSSGIRWSSCLVDGTESPLSPKTDVEPLTNDSRVVLVKWNSKCMSLSSVPVGFNIYYCKSNVQDFGYCTSEVQHVKVNSPSSSQWPVSGLDAGSSYIFSVAVLSLIGEGTQSDPKKIVLREDVPNGPPLNLRTDSVSNTSVSLSWSPPAEMFRGGTITEYQISVVPLIKEKFNFKVKSSEKDFVEYKLEGLRPFTRYDLNISACNSMGCGFKKQARVEFNTTAGAPGKVENFILDVNSWRLMWDLRRCNSRNCSFELQIPVNETDTKLVPVLDKETLSLYEEGVACNNTEMTFFIRAKGQDSTGHFLYGNWSSVTKDAFECPPASLSWWLIVVIVFVCGVLTAVVLLIIKYGWRTIMKAIKDCKQKINLPKGIQVAEPTKEPLKDFSSFNPKDSFSIRDSRDSDPQLLLFPNTSPMVSEDRGKHRADSVSSEEVHLIDDASDRERHGRNLSGSSDHSSGQDSALMSGSPSLTQNEHLDNLPSELTSNSPQETTLRQRSPGPPYVQHGIIPEKLSEGYVTAWSVPSLPHLYKDGFDTLQQSTPDLKKSLFLVGWQNARRASTGYISMPDSENDKESPLRGGKDPLADVSLATAPQRPSDGYTGLPTYVRQNFSPEIKLESAKGGYVTLAQGRSPSPSSGGKNIGYVSAGDPSGNLKRPPSLPLIPKSFSMGEGELPLGAYCRVGSRGNSANQGYVSASRVGELVPMQGLPRGLKNPPYVSCAEAASLSSNRPPKEAPPSTFSPYVELKDGGKWAHPIQPRPPSLASAPMEGGRVGRVGHLPRPNTTEATMGHRRGDGNPSLSKQSSGYVSQETIAPCEAVVMSPKRLMTQATMPHTVVMSPSHQASMV